MKNAILIDNSTYFSFRGLIEQGDIDPPSLYNAMKFVEALITVDELRTAPSSRWRPGQSDELFAKGICSALSASSFGEKCLREIFRKAIHAAEHDVNEPNVQKLLNFGPEVAAEAVPYFGYLPSNVKTIFHLWMNI
jgi:hypothetical protein